MRITSRREKCDSLKKGAGEKKQPATEVAGFILQGIAACGPHAYFEPLQPLLPAGFSTVSFISFLTASAPSSTFFSASASTPSAAFSFAVSTVSFAPSAACSTVFSALPALGVPDQPLEP